jgi:hypothetical protein
VVDLPVSDVFNGYYYIQAESYTDIFTAVWKGINVNYAYWDIEPTGLWDDIWDEYKPKFDGLGANQGDQFQKYLMDMVRPLHDGHFKLSIDDFSPQQERVEKRFTGRMDDANPICLWVIAANDWSGDPFPPAYPGYKKWNFVNDFLGPKYLGGDWGWVATNEGFHIAHGQIPVPEGGHIAYLYFNAFHLLEIMGLESQIKDETQRLVTKQIDAFWKYADDPACKGIIFDLRGNTGGTITDIPYFLNNLLEEDIHFAYTRGKKGEGRLNYTPWTPLIIKAADTEERITQAGKIPIVALVNDYSLSCGEIMPLAIKSMPNGYLIGTQTYGATGPRIGDISPAAFKSGSFTVEWDGGSLEVVQAGLQTRGLHFENYEGIGIVPDEVVPFSWKVFTNNSAYDAGGRDAQLEAAITHITGQVLP